MYYLTRKRILQSFSDTDLRARGVAKVSHILWNSFAGRAQNARWHFGVDARINGIRGQ